MNYERRIPKHGSEKARDDEDSILFSFTRYSGGKKNPDLLLFYQKKKKRE